MYSFQDLPGNILIALAVNFIIGFASYKAKLVDKSGLWSGIVVGVLVFVGFGWEGFVLLFTFFLAGSLASKFKMKTKSKMGVAQKKGGQRGLAHVFANTAVPAVCALVAILAEPPDRPVYFIAFAAALATALGDTISTELGQLYGKRTYLLITLERVRPGTEGAVSAEGTALGFGASILLALAAFGVHPFPGAFGIKAVAIVALAAMMANFIESILGGLYHQFGKESPETLMKLRQHGHRRAARRRVGVVVVFRFSG
ncbi:MAG: DUF92 domain-containing protein [Deltaproteobacteria bacterium]|nr:DUF92 domain-containing protein [Deltaproteobacteria bacterium]